MGILASVKGFDLDVFKDKSFGKLVTVCIIEIGVLVYGALGFIPPLIAISVASGVAGAYGKFNQSERKKEFVRMKKLLEGNIVEEDE